jgi:hypothetical protein
MNYLLPLICLLATTAAAGGETPKGAKEPAEGKVLFRGKMTTEVVSLTVNGKGMNLVGVEIRKGQTVYVQTAQDFSKRAAEKAQKLIALVNDQTKAVTEAAKQHKGDELKKALEGIRRDFEGKKKALEEDAVVVEGVIAKVGKVPVKGGPVNLELGDKRTVLVVGEIREFDPKAKPAPPEPGVVVLRGELQPSKVDPGKDEAAPFSVKSGEVAVAVAGKQAAASTATKGMVRVTGKLRVADNGVAVIDAEEVEAADR